MTPMALNANYRKRALLDLLALVGNEIFARLRDDFDGELDYAAWRHGRLVFHLSSDLHGGLGVYTRQYGDADRPLASAIYLEARPGAREWMGEESDDDEEEDTPPPPPPSSDLDGPLFAPPPPPPPSTTTAPVHLSAPVVVTSASIPTIFSVSGGASSSFVSSVTMRDSSAAPAASSGPVPSSTQVVSSSVPVATQSSFLVPSSSMDGPFAAGAAATLAPPSVPPSSIGDNSSQIVALDDNERRVEKEHKRSTSKDVPKQLILRLSSLKAKTATPSLTPPSLPLPPSSAIDPSESVTLVDDTIDEMEQINLSSPLPNWDEDDERWQEERRRRMEQRAIDEAKKVWGPEDTSERCIVYSERFGRGLPIWVTELYDDERVPENEEEGEEGVGRVEIAREDDGAAERWEIDGVWTNPLMDDGPLVNDDDEGFPPLSPTLSLPDHSQQKERRKRTHSAHSSEPTDDGASPAKRVVYPQYIVDALTARDRLFTFLDTDHAISLHSSSITAGIADDDLVSYWRSLSATLRIRNGLVETNAHLSVSRFSTSFILNSENEDSVTEFTAATEHILDRLMEMTDLVRRRNKEEI
ncbi:hypothetical protein PRIPAC_73346, partial [Pristionchus pacificus]|uniref:Uncharacterized protein n=1 Tax=Pristionchus pacificus TaxID=54126 RepID=A0A2A6CGR0_PRIPA